MTALSYVETLTSWTGLFFCGVIMRSIAIMIIIMITILQRLMKGGVRVEVKIKGVPIITLVAAVVILEEGILKRVTNKESGRVQISVYSTSYS